MMKRMRENIDFFANSTKISPPLGQLQPPWGLRTALGHLMGNKSKCERRGRRGRRAKVISMIRRGTGQKQELQQKENFCKRENKADQEESAILELNC